MSDNKIGAPPSNPINPDDPEYLAAAEAQLASNVPSQPFNVNRDTGQNQNNNKSQDAAKQQQKKEEIKKEQEKQAAQKASAEAQESQKKPSPLDSSLHAPAKGKLPAEKAPATPQTPMRSKLTPQPEAPKQEHPSPFSLARETTAKPALPTTTKPAKTDLETPKQPLPSTSEAKQPTTTQKMPPSPPGKGLSAEETKLAELKASKAAKTAEEAAKTSQTAEEAAKAAASKQETAPSQPTTATGMAPITPQSGQAGKGQASSQVSSVSEKFSRGQERTEDKDQEWKFKEKLSEKTDVKEDRLSQKATGEQVSDQRLSKAENVPTSAPTGATGTTIAERVNDVLRTQEDFINLVASVATNERQTQVQLKDGTLINLNRTDQGLDIAVTTPDSRVHRLLLDNRTSITHALNQKNIKVASLQVSMEYGKPIEGVGRES